jgi:hypothetical protein
MGAVKTNRLERKYRLSLFEPMTLFEKGRGLKIKRKIYSKYNQGAVWHTVNNRRKMAGLPLIRQGKS